MRRVRASSRPAIRTEAREGPVESEDRQVAPVVRQALVVLAKVEPAARKALAVLAATEVRAAPVLQVDLPVRRSRRCRVDAK